MIDNKFIYKNGKIIYGECNFKQMSYLEYWKHFYKFILIRYFKEIIECFVDFGKAFYEMLTSLIMGVLLIVLAPVALMVQPYVKLKKYK